MGRPKNIHHRAEETDLRKETAPIVPEAIPPAIPEPLPELRLQPQAYRVMEEKLVIIHGGTTYVAAGKIVRDPQILAKLREQKVVLEPYVE